MSDVSFGASGLLERKAMAFLEWKMAKNFPQEGLQGPTAWDIVG